MKSETLGKFKDKLSRLPWTENIENVVSLIRQDFFVRGYLRLMKHFQKIF